MFVNSIPYDNADTAEGHRKPVPWIEEDERNWEKGLVQCPNTRGARRPERKYCIYSKEMDAISAGYLSVLDEKGGEEI